MATTPKDMKLTDSCLPLAGQFDTGPFQMDDFSPIPIGGSSKPVRRSSQPNMMMNHPMNQFGQTSQSSTQQNNSLSPSSTANKPTRRVSLQSNLLPGSQSPQQSLSPRPPADLPSLADPTSTKSLEQSFPTILHHIVTDEESNDCIHWLPCGQRFLISNKDVFAKTIIPKYFDNRGGTKFTSFTRRLKRWNFERVPSGPQMGAYFHPCFKRGDPELALEISYPNNAMGGSRKFPRRASTGTVPGEEGFGGGGGGGGGVGGGSAGGKAGEKKKKGKGSARRGSIPEEEELNEFGTTEHNLSDGVFGAFPTSLVNSSSLSGVDGPGNGMGNKSSMMNDPRFRRHSYTVGDFGGDSPEMTFSSMGPLGPMSNGLSGSGSGNPMGGGGIGGMGRAVSVGTAAPTGTRGGLGGGGGPDPSPDSNARLEYLLEQQKLALQFNMAQKANKSGANNLSYMPKSLRPNDISNVSNMNGAGPNSSLRQSKPGNGTLSEELVAKQQMVLQSMWANNGRVLPPGPVVSKNGMGGGMAANMNNGMIQSMTPMNFMTRTVSGPAPGPGNGNGPGGMPPPPTMSMQQGMQQGGFFQDKQMSFQGMGLKSGMGMNEPASQTMFSMGQNTGGGFNDGMMSNSLMMARMSNGGGNNNVANSTPSVSLDSNDGFSNQRRPSLLASNQGVGMNDVLQHNPLQSSGNKSLGGIGSNDDMMQNSLNSLGPITGDLNSDQISLTSLGLGSKDGFLRRLSSMGSSSGGAPNELRRLSDGSNRGIFSNDMQSLSSIGPLLDDLQNSQSSMNHSGEGSGSGGNETQASNLPMTSLKPHLSGSSIGIGGMGLDNEPIPFTGLSSGPSLSSGNGGLGFDEFCFTSDQMNNILQKELMSKDSKFSDPHPGNEGDFSTFQF